MIWQNNVVQVLMLIYSKITQEVKKILFEYQ